MAILHRGLDADTVLTPFVPRLVAGNIEFVCRYLKNLQITEIAALSASGIKIVSIFESSGDRSLQGYNAGVADGQYARKQAQTLGQPAGSAIYATVDTDVTDPNDIDNVTDYFAGFDSAIFGAYDIGAYAEGTVLEALKEHGLKYLWLAGAMGWDGSRGDQDWHLWQGPTLPIQGGTWANQSWSPVGFEFDPDIAVVDEFGAWTKPGPSGLVAA